MTTLLSTLILAFCWGTLFVAAGIFSGWLTVTGIPAWLTEPLLLIHYHLRLSIIPFSGLFIAYLLLIARLRRELTNGETSLAALSYYDRLLNTVIATFFGVGVIWTAIGMEGALVAALDGLQTGGQQQALTALGMLEKLVNGGLLIALSTTVFGGVCGYLLRLLKIVLLGRDWDRFILGEQFGKQEKSS
ncbi:MAG: hypothetical protein JRJ56_08755 [Deltaproteobacteria bacterium]|nr:hypothetical protein [Deltaproteobacteria bacterium]